MIQAARTTRRTFFANLAALALAAREQQAAAASPAKAAPAIDRDPPRHRFALALSGGCIRAFAHVGVIKAFAESGLHPDLVVGSSSGSLVGALYCAQPDAAALERTALSLRWDDLEQFRPSKYGFYSLEPMREFVNRRTGGQRIEQFSTRFAAVATDLRTGEPKLIDAGEPGLAVMASASAPGLVRPTHIDGRDYVDGSIVAPTPVRAARALGAATVIAVSVNFLPEEAAPSNGFDVAVQAFYIAAGRVLLEDVQHADLVIRPRLPPLEDMRMENNPAILAAGERAGRLAVPQVRAALARAAQA